MIKFILLNIAFNWINILAIPINNLITYNNGLVLTGTRKVHLLFYGTWNQNETSILTELVSSLSSTPWWTIHKQYKNRAGITAADIVLGNIAFDKLSQGTNLSGGLSQIRQLISNSINSGAFHGTNQKFPDPTGLYTVLTSAEVTQSFLCSSLCGYHDKWTHNSGRRMYSMFVGNPSKCINVCSPQNSLKSPNNNPSIDSMASVLAHEITETITDPEYYTGWADSNRLENADKCAYTYGNTTTDITGFKWNMKLPNGRKYLIQQNLSPVTQKCQMSV